MAYKKHVLICGGTGCLSSKGGAIAENIESLLVEKGMNEEVQVIKTGCFIDFSNSLYEIKYRLVFEPWTGHMTIGEQIP